MVIGKLFTSIFTDSNKYVSLVNVKRQSFTSKLAIKTSSKERAWWYSWPGKVRDRVGFWVSWSEWDGVRVSEEWGQCSAGSEWDLSEWNGKRVSEAGFEWVISGPSEWAGNWVSEEWGQCSGGSEWGQKERIIAGRSLRLSPLAPHSHAPHTPQNKKKTTTKN